MIAGLFVFGVVVLAIGVVAFVYSTLKLDSFNQLGIAGQIGAILSEDIRQGVALYGVVQFYSMAFLVGGVGTAALGAVKSQR